MTKYAYLRAMFRLKKYINKAFFAPAVVLSFAALIGCASTGTPGGGLYDETPPELRTSDPGEGATGVNKKKLTLRFNENIKLDNAQDKLTISPPQEKSPAIKSNAKTLTIELFDDLKPNTTYTIDLGDAVQDNNEGNPMENLTLTFSTGEHIDTMKVSGVLLNAEDLEPITGAYVGIYKVYDDGRLVEGDTLHGVDSIVALYPDSIFMLKPFDRAGKTDSEGRFRISGVAPGKYRIYALADGNTNYKYDLFTEDIAIFDSLISPQLEPCTIYDTIYSKMDLLSLEIAINNNRKENDKDKKDKKDDKEQESIALPIDTIIARDGFRYLPDNLCLLAFNEGRVTRYLDDITWTDSIHIDLRFSAKMPTPPEISLLDEDSLGIAAINKDAWLICEPNPTNDTLKYWIRDPRVYSRDTLNLLLTYLFTHEGADTLVTDTLALVNPVPKVEKKPAPQLPDSVAAEIPAPAEDEEIQEDEETDNKADKAKKKKKKRKKKNKEEEQPTDSVPRTTFMTISMLEKNTIDIGRLPHIEASAPIDSLDLQHLHLLQQKDSLWVPLDYSLKQDSLLLRRYTVVANPHFSPGGSYRLIADSASMRDIYGHPVDSTCISFTEKKVDDYAHLVFNITGVNGPAFVQLLNEKDKPVRQMPVKDGQAKFVNIPAGKYYARLVEDKNDNGVFDAGSVLEHRQPESVYYFGSLLELRTWQYSQSWDVHEKPVPQQKPKELIQNKPKTKAVKKNRNLEYLHDHPDLKKKYINSL